MNDYINRQVEIRARAWGEAKALLDHAAAEGRDLTAAETEQYDRINAELDERTAVIDSLMKDQEREVRAAELRVPATTETRVTEKSDTDILRELVAGERRSYTFEKRQMTTASDAGTVPQGFYDVMQEILRYTGPALDPASGYTVLNTASGEEIKVPVQSTFSTATATAEAAAFAVNNPTTTSFGLKAYKFGTLVTISRELLQDSGIDIEAFIARQAGNDLGRIINEKLAVGAGSTEPTGIVTASGSGITGGTAVGGAFTADNLIDLVHSVDSAYAGRPGAAFQMRRSTLSVLRKLKDNQGAFLYNPTQGTQALVLGYPVIENPGIVAVGTAAKSVVFGDMSSYHVRQVGGIEVARSDDAFFVNDLVAFRVSMRIDANLGQASAVKHFIGNAA
jgi:HK97 family phage major capsid protein